MDTYSKDIERKMRQFADGLSEKDRRRFTRACQGVIFHTLEVARQFMERAKTTTGLRVTVSVLEKVYATGRKYAAGFKETMKIVFDDFLPKWNYRALPEA